MQKLNGVNHSMSVKSQNRRKSVILRLEAQLKSKTKTGKGWIGLEPINNQIELSEQDIQRINKELTILKSRV